MYLFIDYNFTDLKNTLLQPTLDALSNTKSEKITKQKQKINMH